MFQDSLGRGIAYLRLSLTEACSMRCTYCRPAIHGQPKGHEVLSVAEIDWLVRDLVSNYGLRKIRLTGGDPTSRAELTTIIRTVSSIPGIEDLAHDHPMA